MKELSLIEKALFLKKISLFEDLDLEFLIGISNKIYQDIYDKGEKIFEINQKASKMYFIAKGKVSLLDENQKEIILLEKENFFADESLFNNDIRKYSAICSIDSLILSLNKHDLLNIILKCPIIAISFLHDFAKTTFCRYKK